MAKRPFDNLADVLMKTLSSDAEQIAGQIKAEVAAGASAQTRDEYLSILARNWANPAFRQAELQRMGPDQFVSAWKDAVKGGYLPPPSSQPAAVPAFPGVPTSPPMSSPAPTAPVAGIAPPPSGPPPMSAGPLAPGPGGAATMPTMNPGPQVGIPGMGQ